VTYEVETSRESVLKKESNNDLNFSRKVLSEVKKKFMSDLSKVISYQIRYLKANGLASGDFTELYIKSKRWELNKEASHTSVLVVFKIFIFLANLGSLLNSTSDFGGAAGCAGTASIFSLMFIDFLLIARKITRCNPYKCPIHWINMP